MSIFKKKKVSYEDVMKLYEELPDYIKHNILGDSISFQVVDEINENTNALGMCCYKGSDIEIKICNKIHNKKKLKSVVYHEIAHALDWKIHEKIYHEDGHICMYKPILECIFKENQFFYECPSRIKEKDSLYEYDIVEFFADSISDLLCGKHFSDSPMTQAEFSILLKEIKED